MNRSNMAITAMGLVSSMMSYVAFAGCPTLPPAVPIPPPLTTTTLNELLGGNGLAALELDDEGLVESPLYLNIRNVNTSSGSFGGTISTAPQGGMAGQTYYSVSGTLTQEGSGLGISFSYSTNSNLRLGALYNYSGAIAETCNNGLFLAGTYTTSQYVLVQVSLGMFQWTWIKSAPLPFSSGKQVFYFWQ